jgi:hypothetical protein
MFKEIKTLKELDQLVEDQPLEITDGSWFVYQWQCKGSGSFTTALSKAISVADGSNLVCLYKAFPDEVLAMRSFSIKSGYWPMVFDHYRKEVA